MATYEHNALQQYKDSSNNMHVIYPVTKAECIADPQNLSVGNANTVGGKGADAFSNKTHTHTKSEITNFPTTMPPTAHSHSKSEITDFPTSLPASDVYSWAKANTKPSYSKSEVGLSNVPNVTTNNQTPTFSAASSRENIASGEKLSVIFGKIMKFFADLKTVAFSGSYTDLSNTPTIPAAVAVKGNAESSYRTGNVNLTPENIGAATSSHNHAASNITSGVLPITRGGTGCSTGAELSEMIKAYSGGAEVETGTFNLTYNGSKVATCKYCKVGNLVYVYAMTSLSQAVPARAMLDGLPFTVENAFCAIGAIGQTNGNLVGISSAFTNLNLIQGTQISCTTALDPAGPFSLAIIYVTS